MKSQAIRTSPQKAQNVDPLLIYCWSTVCDAGPTLNQHWADASCLMVRRYSIISWYPIQSVTISECEDNWIFHTLLDIYIGIRYIARVVSCVSRTTVQVNLSYPSSIFAPRKVPIDQNETSSTPLRRWVCVCAWYLRPHRENSMDLYHIFPIINDYLIDQHTHAYSLQQEVFPRGMAASRSLALL